MNSQGSLPEAKVPCPALHYCTGLTRHKSVYGLGPQWRESLQKEAFCPDCLHRLASPTGLGTHPTFKNVSRMQQDVSLGVPWEAGSEEGSRKKQTDE